MSRPESSLTGVLIRSGDQDADTQGRPQGKDSPGERPQEKKEPSPHPDLRRLPSGTVRKQVSVVYATCSVVFFSGNKFRDWQFLVVVAASLLSKMFGDPGSFYFLPCHPQHVGTGLVPSCSSTPCMVACLPEA